MSRIPSHANQGKAVWKDFSKGIDAGQPPESIAENALVRAENARYDPLTSALETRPGTTLIKEGTSFDGGWSDGTNCFVWSGRAVSLLDPSTGTLSGTATLPGSGTPVFATFGDSREVYTAAGGALRKWSGSAWTTPTATKGTLPTAADWLESKAGRLIVARKADLMIQHSGVGDALDWLLSGSSWNEADSLQISAGYKSGGIPAWVGLFQDSLAIVANSGIFLVENDYPSWNVVTKCPGHVACYGACPAFGDVLLLTSSGIRSLSTVISTGYLHSPWGGDGINGLLPSDLSHWRLIRMDRASEVWLIPPDSATVYVYNAVVGAWTSFVFPAVVSAAVEHSGTIYVSCGGDLISLSGYTDSGASVVMSLELKPYDPFGDVVVSEIGLCGGYGSVGTAEVSVSGLKRTVSLSNPDLPVSEDLTVIGDDIDPVYSRGKLDHRLRVNLRTSRISPKISFTGPCSIRSLHVVYGAV